MASSNDGADTALHSEEKAPGAGRAASARAAVHLTHVQAHERLEQAVKYGRRFVMLSRRWGASVWQQLLETSRECWKKLEDRRAPSPEFKAHWHLRKAAISGSSCAPRQFDSRHILQAT